MIEHRLLFLGLLKESPKHGYEIKKRIREILSTFAGVEPKSIYYPLKKIEEEGLVTKETTKAGRRPERFVYSLTSKGEAKFKELFNKSLIEFKRPLFNLDLSLYFLPYIKPEFARRRLKARIQLLSRVTKGLKSFIQVKKQEHISPCLLSILEHNIFMLQAEIRFLKQLIGNLK